MEPEKDRGEARGRRTFDELPMESSKSFVMALQELKNLQPQLYSAAEYCEKSYFNSDDKQLVLENLKDYTVRAVVNAIDHLGTVAFKLGDIVDQQTMEISSLELKVTNINQQLLTCQTYTDNEGLRQQQLLAVIPRHHKRYMLPNSVNKKVHFSPHVQTDPRQPVQARGNVSHSGAASSKSSLSWHLASESKSSSRSSSHEKTSGAFNFSEAEDAWMKSGSLSSLQQRTHGGSNKRELLESSKPSPGNRTFVLPTEREVSCTPVRSRGLLSAFFKQKTHKVKTNM